MFPGLLHISLMMSTQDNLWYDQSTQVMDG